MEIKRSGSQPSRKGPAEYFTGTVRIDPVFDAPEPARIRCAKGNRAAIARERGLTISQKKRQLQHRIKQFCKAACGQMTGRASNPEFPDIAKAFEHLVGQRERGL